MTALECYLGKCLIWPAMLHAFLHKRGNFLARDVIVVRRKRVNRDYDLPGSDPEHLNAP